MVGTLPQTQDSQMPGSMAPIKKSRNTTGLPLALNPLKSKEVLAVLAERNQAIVPVGAWVEPASPHSAGIPAYTSAYMIEEELKEQLRKKQEALKHFQRQVKHRVNQQIRLRKKQQLQKSYEAAEKEGSIVMQSSDPAYLTPKRTSVFPNNLNASIGSARLPPFRMLEDGIEDRENQNQLFLQAQALSQTMKQARHRLASFKTESKKNTSVFPDDTRKSFPTQEDPDSKESSSIMIDKKGRENLLWWDQQDFLSEDKDKPFSRVRKVQFKNPLFAEVEDEELKKLHLRGLQDILPETQDCLPEAQGDLLEAQGDLTGVQSIALEAQAVELEGQAVEPRAQAIEPEVQVVKTETQGSMLEALSTEPKDGAVMLEDQAFLPKDQHVLPQNQNILPTCQDQDFLPKDQNIRPICQDQDFLPSDQNILLKCQDQKFPSKDQCVLPKDQHVFPKDQDFLPRYQKVRFKEPYPDMINEKGRDDFSLNTFFKQSSFFVRDERVRDELPLEYHQYVNPQIQDQVSPGDQSLYSRQQPSVGTAERWRDLLLDGHQHPSPKHRREASSIRQVYDEYQSGLNTEFQTPRALQSGADQEEDRKERQKQYLRYRRLFMDMEREQVKEQQRQKEHRKKIEKIKKKKERQRYAEEQRILRMNVREEPYSGEKMSEILAQLQLEEIKETREKQQREKEYQRYVEALRAQIKEKIQLYNITLPPLCCCGPDFWDAHPDTCANNCIFYKNHRAYTRALHSVINSCDIPERNSTLRVAIHNFASAHRRTLKNV